MADDSMTRRQLLIAASTGVVGIAAGAWGLSQISDETRANLENEINKMQNELNKLQTLVKLYEQLEKIGLDNILATGLSMMRGVFDALRAGVRLVRDGITVAENAWKNFQAMLALLRTTADRVGQMANELASKFRLAEGFVIGVIGAALPLAESIAGFFNSLLQKIPFVGEDIKRAANGLVEVIRSIPAFVETVTTQLIKQINDLFLQGNTSSINTTLMDPLSKNLLEPLKNFLTDVENAIAQLEKSFIMPVQSALDERKAVRKQIAEYRQQFNV
jgi:hypothetical protein